MSNSCLWSPNIPSAFIYTGKVYKGGELDNQCGERRSGVAGLFTGLGRQAALR